ncbi:hypothetical protein SLEP1_g49486 [Rubroshorea leprosula]|uniref:Uncharacterized protein n=1 Tax=Rubroshorea leprosula TaxID=152421 RepID=A0AAV5LXX8_9ROSI|nr:hypothetical protein SLEP1_g49486 [Rubroshorea leprosula]
MMVHQHGDSTDLGKRKLDPYPIRGEDICLHYWRTQPSKEFRRKIDVGKVFNTRAKKILYLGKNHVQKAKTEIMMHQMTRLVLWNSSSKTVKKRHHFRILAFPSYDHSIP